MPANRFRKTVANERIYPSFPTSALFTRLLTDDGTDFDLNEDYSSAAADAYYTFTAPAAIQSLGISMFDGSIAQNLVVTHEAWVGDTAALTNGWLIQVQNSAGTVLLDLTSQAAITRILQLDALSDWVQSEVVVADVDTADNSATYSCRINFEKLFGKAIEVNVGDKFVIRLRDNHANLGILRFRISGYYL